MTTSKTELSALALVKEIQQCHNMTFVKADEALDWAIRCGELLSLSKSYLEHGKFGGFVEQYFDFSLRSAQAYMKLHKDLQHIPKAQRLRLLKEAASINSLQKLLNAPEGDAPPKRLPAPQPEPEPEPESDPEPEPEPGALDGFDPSGWQDSEEEPTTETTPTTSTTRTTSNGNGNPPKKNSRAFWYKQWTHSIGPLCRLVDKIAEGVGEKRSQSHKCVQDHLEVATQEMMEWMGVKR